MALFGKGKSLVEQAEDERMKLDKKKAHLQSMQLDRQMIQENKKKQEAVRRLTA